MLMVRTKGTIFYLRGTYRHCIFRNILRMSLDKIYQMYLKVSYKYEYNNEKLIYLF